YDGRRIHSSAEKNANRDVGSHVKSNSLFQGREELFYVMRLVIVPIFAGRRSSEIHVPVLGDSDSPIVPCQGETGRQFRYAVEDAAIAGYIPVGKVRLNGIDI